jgi:hypothetical protein
MGDLLDRPKPGESVAAALGRTLAQDASRRLVQIGEEGPADITALRALTRVESLRTLPLDGAETPAPQALDGVLLGHATLFGGWAIEMTPSNEGGAGSGPDMSGPYRPEADRSRRGGACPARIVVPPLQSVEYLG